MHEKLKYLRKNPTFYELLLMDDCPTLKTLAEMMQKLALFVVAILNPDKKLLSDGEFELLDSRSEKIAESRALRKVFEIEWVRKEDGAKTEIIIEIDPAVNLTRPDKASFVTIRVNPDSEDDDNYWQDRIIPSTKLTCLRHIPVDWPVSKYIPEWFAQRAPYIIPNAECELILTEPELEWMEKQGITTDISSLAPKIMEPLLNIFQPIWEDPLDRMQL